MSSFLKAMSKLGLVELEEEERAKLAQSRRKKSPNDQTSTDDMAELDRILAETKSALQGDSRKPATSQPIANKTPAAAPSPAPQSPVTTPIANGGASGLIEGRPMADIYLEAMVPPSSFSAEKLLKVLEGLKALPPATRKAAVLAMDSADENWSIADAILDAQRKTRVLRTESERLSVVLTDAEQLAQQSLADQDRYLEKATALIQEEIAKLQTQLQQETQTVDEQKAATKAQLLATREGVARERQRFEHEIHQLSQVPHTFGDSE